MNSDRVTKCHGCGLDLIWAHHRFPPRNSLQRVCECPDDTMVSEWQAGSFVKTVQSWADLYKRALQHAAGEAAKATQETPTADCPACREPKALDWIEAKGYHSCWKCGHQVRT